MNARKYNTDPVLLLEQRKAIMSSTDESTYLFRVFAVNMVLSGTPASLVGASAGFSKAAVTGWVKQWMNKDSKRSVRNGARVDQANLQQSNWPK